MIEQNWRFWSYLGLLGIGGLGVRRRLHNSHSPFAFRRKEAEGVTGSRRMVLSKQWMSLLNESLVLSQSEHCMDGVDTRSNIFLDDIGWSTPGHEENNMKNPPCDAAGCGLVRVHAWLRRGSGAILRKVNVSLATGGLNQEIA